MESLEVCGRTEHSDYIRIFASSCGYYRSGDSTKFFQSDVTLISFHCSMLKLSVYSVHGAEKLGVFLRENNHFPKTSRFLSRAEARHLVKDNYMDSRALNKYFFRECNGIIERRMPFTAL